MELTRETIEIPSLEWNFIETENGTTAHLMLSRFGDKTMTEWEHAVSEIRAKPNVTGIILDMRGNPGGYLDAGIEVASEFVNGGLIVSQQGRQSTQNYRATRVGRPQDYPVIANGQQRQCFSLRDCGWRLTETGVTPNLSANKHLVKERFRTLSKLEMALD